MESNRTMIRFSKYLSGVLLYLNLILAILCFFLYQLSIAWLFVVMAGVFWVSRVLFTAVEKDYQKMIEGLDKQSSRRLYGGGD